MAASFVAYIDESGDEGLCPGRGATEWLVLSAVITRKATDLATVKVVDDVRGYLGKPAKKPLHFRKLKHKERLLLLDAIAGADLAAISVVVHKPSLTNPQSFKERNRLYFYTARFLLERISWYCRDALRCDDSGDGSAEVVFSKRDDLRYDELQSYMQVLQNLPDGGGIDWRVLNPEQIEAYSHGRRMGLQIADAVASGTMAALRAGPEGKGTDEYICRLRPVVYHRRGKYLGYGLKFFPRELNKCLATDERFRWLRETYAGPGT